MLLLIAVGSDHRGFETKEKLLRWLGEAGHSCQDLGCYDTGSVDYPDIAQKVASSVREGSAAFGILICGTGIGMSIAANKVGGIRAALCHNVFSAQRARQHNDANILCLSAEEDSTGIPDIVAAFLKTGFEGGHHRRRLDKIEKIEAEERSI